MAPGVAIYSADRTGTEGYVAGDYVTVSGTSFASPYAAGVAALLLSVNPSLGPLTLESLLRSSARDSGTPGFDNYTGWGHLRAGEALKLASGIAGQSSLRFRQGAIRGSGQPSVSSDGQRTVFDSWSNNLVGDDGNDQRDVSCGTRVWARRSV